MKRPRPAKSLLIPKEAKKVFDGVIYDIYQWPQKQFDDSIKTYEGLRRKDTAIILPVIGEEVVIIKERQPHWPDAAYNIIAGGIEDDEEIFDGTRRELEEETGLVFKDIHLVGIDQITLGIEWFAYTFVAKNLIDTKEKKLDSGEQNEVVKISFNELLDLTRQKKFFHRARFIEDFLINRKEDEFFEMLRHPEKFEIK